MNGIKEVMKVVFWIAVGAACVLTGGLFLIVVVLGAIGKLAVDAAMKKEKKG